MRRGYTRRQFISTTAKLGAASIVAGALPFPAFISRQLSAATDGFLTPEQMETLGAALDRMIPASSPGDWTARTVGAGDYIQGLLSLDLETDPAGTIFAGGPFRAEFPNFQTLSRVKREGWKKEIARLRAVYTAGLADLDERARLLSGGKFKDLLPEAQDVVLNLVDLEGTNFFAALYAHTMEGVYGHPVYGGNKSFQAWESVCYQGDVHGVHYPDGQNADGNAWNVFGGYSPDEMIQPGACPGQGPETS